MDREKKNDRVREGAGGGAGRGHSSEDSKAVVQTYKLIVRDRITTKVLLIHENSPFVNSRSHFVGKKPLTEYRTIGKYSVLILITGNGTSCKIRPKFRATKVLRC
jgi:hypothetical protein